jgi:hypothetical protein
MVVEDLGRVGPPAPATDDLVPLPPRVASALIEIALRTDLGRAYWDGYCAAFLDRCPWLGGPVEFWPRPGDVAPRRGAQEDGRAER